MIISDFQGFPGIPGFLGIPGFPDSFPGIPGFLDIIRGSGYYKGSIDGELSCDTWKGSPVINCTCDTSLVVFLSTCSTVE